MSIKVSNGALYPLAYPWAFEYWKRQQEVHWMPEEASMGDDIKDWKVKLNDVEKYIITQIFRLFNKSDEEIKNCYADKYKKFFKRTEVSMMLSAFENMETIHLVAYAHLLQTLGLPEVEFHMFSKYEEMQKKLDFIHSFDPTNDMELAEAIAGFSAATEGISLFASFAILLNFPRHNKLKGMGDIIAWSIRDESMHCEAMAMVFKTLVEEQDLDKKILQPKVEAIIRQAVENEFAFIDLVFAQGDLEDLTPQEVKDYMKWIANLRYNQLGFEERLYEIEYMPLSWIPGMLNAAEHANFFETRATDYAKGATGGEWDDNAYEF